MAHGEAGLPASGVEELVVPAGDGRSLDVLVSGPSSGPVLVWHSGTPCGLVPLPGDVDPGRRGYRTVVYARPGYARSTPAPGRKVSDAAGDVAAMLDALGADTFLNVGFSGGGPPALACAALLGDRCRATAVIGGLAPYTELEASSPARAWYTEDPDNRRALAGDLDGFRQGLAAFAASMAEVTAEGLAASTGAAADRSYLADGHGDWLAALFREAWASGTAGAEGDFLSLLGEWGFPLDGAAGVHVWHGTDDRNVPVAHGEWLASHLPGAVAHLLDGEGHLSPLGRLAEVLADLDPPD